MKTMNTTKTMRATPAAGLPVEALVSPAAARWFSHCSRSRISGMRRASSAARRRAPAYEGNRVAGPVGGVVGGAVGAGVGGAMGAVKGVLGIPDRGYRLPRLLRRHHRFHCYR